MNKINAAINGYGPALRLITPLLSLLIATLLTLLLTDVREVKLDLKTFQASVNTLDKRVAVIEANRFTAKDGHKLMETIVDKLPPPWLIRKVDDHADRLKYLENGRTP